MKNKLSSFVFACLIPGLFALASHTVLAADYPLEQKLQQCETAFKESRNNTATREQAAKARDQHLKLMAEILQHLNDANVKAADQGRPLTPEELSKNVRVMGHLTEMLVETHIAPSYDWSYVY